MKEARRPKDEQIDEWFESQVTEYFFFLIENLKAVAYDKLADQGFDTDSAERLQAQRGNLWGIYNTLEDIGSVFEVKSLDELEEIESAGEHVGDSPLGRSDTH